MAFRILGTTPYTKYKRLIRLSVPLVSSQIRISRINADVLQEGDYDQFKDCSPETVQLGLSLYLVDGVHSIVAFDAFVMVGIFAHAEWDDVLQAMQDLLSMN